MFKLKKKKRLISYKPQIFFFIGRLICSETWQAEIKMHIKLYFTQYYLIGKSIYKAVKPVIFNRFFTE